MSTYKRIYPKLGRAGLGNELFPYLRAVDSADQAGLPMVPPRWLQVRVGPYLRGERDVRNYWTIFRRPTFREFLKQLVLDCNHYLAMRYKPLKEASRSTLFVTGMADYFRSFIKDGHWYRDYLERNVRGDQLSAPLEQRYFSFHVRLGDFARASDDTKVISANNMGTPISWYIDVLARIRAVFPYAHILVSSDGTDSELAALLEAPGVERTQPLNALDELFIMSRAEGIVGSRSTFSSWGAFLGCAPLFLMAGGNAYPPHDQVWEDTAEELFEEWLDAVAIRSGWSRRESHGI